MSVDAGVPETEHLPSCATLRWYDGESESPALIVWTAMGVPARKY